MPRWAAMGDVDGAGMADVDPSTIGTIYDEATLGIPPAGPYLCTGRWLRAKESKNGNPMLTMSFEIAEPAGTKKAKYNGYRISTFNRVVGKDYAPQVNAFLHALWDDKTPAARRKLIEAFWAGKIIIADDDTEYVTKIGTWTVPDTFPMGVVTRKGSYNDQERLEVSSVMGASLAPKGTAADVAEPDEDDEDVADEGAEEGTEEDARAEELEGLTLVKLKAEAKKAGVEVKRGAKAEDLIEAILDAEFGDVEVEDDDEEPEDDPEDVEVEEEEDEEEPEEDDEPEGDEFDEMDRAALKKALKANGIELRVTTKTTDDEIRDALRAEPEADEEEDEDDEEEEPEPPARRARATKAPAARPAAKRRGKTSDEPPF